MNLLLPGLLALLLPPLLSGGLTTTVSSPMAPLSAEEEARYHGSPEDELDKPICPKDGLRATEHCRDRAHYVRTNEAFHQLYRPYIQNVGGGYLGIGSDQNFTFIAWAGSEFAWIMDYDPYVVAVNRIHLALIEESPSAEVFVGRWSAEHKKSTVALLRKRFRDRKDAGWLINRFINNRERLHRWLSRNHKRKSDEPSHWLQSDASYQRIHGLVKAGRIRVMNGDLLKDLSVNGIAAVTRSGGLPMQVVYLSNAEEFWSYTKAFRQNFKGMGFGPDARILRTSSTRRLGERLDGRYVYFVQTGGDFQESLADPQVTSVRSFYERAEKTEQVGLFTLGEPARAPKGKDAL